MKISRLYVVIPDGRAEIKPGSGEKWRSGKGGVLHAQDLTGKGQQTRAIGRKPLRQTFATLP